MLSAASAIQGGLGHDIAPNSGTSSTETSTEEGGNVPGGAVGPVSGEVLPSLRETFYIHHEDESFKHVPFGELVLAYNSG